MSSYDIERSQQGEAAIRKAFKTLFPLVNDADLPWAAIHIAEFLRTRIKDEVDRGTSSFVSRIARILCEVSPPKTHMEDMARIVVEKAKRADELAKEKERRLYYQDIVYVVCNLIDGERKDGGKTVSGTLESPSSDVQETLKAIFANNKTIVSDKCAGCENPLLVENAWMHDGCPCNSPLGVNYMNEMRWLLLIELQQKQAREKEALANFKSYVHRRLDEAGVPVDPESPHKAEGCRIGGRLDIVLAKTPSFPASSEIARQLEILAEWFDLQDLKKRPKPSNEVQRDLRRWAADIRTAIANGEQGKVGQKS